MASADHNCLPDSRLALSGGLPRGGCTGIRGARTAQWAWMPLPGTSAWRPCLPPPRPWRGTLLTACHVAASDNLSVASGIFNEFSTKTSHSFTELSLAHSHFPTVGLRKLIRIVFEFKEQSSRSARYRRWRIFVHAVHVLNVHWMSYWTNWYRVTAGSL